MSRRAQNPRPTETEKEPDLLEAALWLANEFGVIAPSAEVALERTRRQERG